MPRFQKLLQRFINEPDKITFDECSRFLFEFGYEVRKRPGSEVVSHKKGCIAINVPLPKESKYVKSPYIKRIIKLLDLEHYREDRDE